ncbi:hypothetical protein QOT17_016411 [Balamuthia mandrillaris]
MRLSFSFTCLLLFFTSFSAAQRCVMLEESMHNQIDPKCLPLLLDQNQPIYIPANQTLADLTEQASASTIYLGVWVPPACRDAALLLACHYSYKICNGSSAVSPCLSLCNSMSAECTEYFESVGRANMIPPCTTFLFPNSSCNPGSTAKVGYSQADCPYPTVYNPDITDDFCALPCPGTIYTEEQWDALYSVMTLFGAISLVASTFYVVTSFLNPDTRRFPVNVLNFLTLSTVPVSLGLVFGVFAGGSENIICSDKGEYQGVGRGDAGGLACVLQGILLVFGGLCVACWWTIAAFNLVMLIVVQVSRDKLHKFEKWYHIIGWTLPVLLTIIPLAAKKIQASPTVSWCFIYDEDTDWWIYGNFYILFIGSWLFGSLLILGVVITILRRSYQFDKKGNLPFRVVIRLLVMMCLFWGLTAFQIAYRFYGSAIKDDITEALEEQVVCSASTGTECELKEKPNFGFLLWTVLVMTNLGAFAFLTIGCTKTTFNFWRGLIKDLWRAKGRSNKIQVWRNYTITRDRARSRSAFNSNETRSRTPSGYNMGDSPRQHLEQMGLTEMYAGPESAAPLSQPEDEVDSSIEEGKSSQSPSDSASSED